MPVYKLLAEMPHEELLMWIEYFRQRPVGWREDDRTMKLLQVQGCKEAPEKIFNSLKVIYSPPDEGINTLKGSAMFKMMMSSVGGARLS